MAQTLKLERLIAGRAFEINGRIIWLRSGEAIGSAGGAVEFPGAPVFAQDAGDLRSSFVSGSEIDSALNVHVSAGCS